MPVSDPIFRPPTDTKRTVAIKAQTRGLRSLSILGALLVAGCASASQLTTVWTDPRFETNSLRKLMVIGIAKSPTSRRLIEDRFAAALKALGIEAEPSYPLVGDGNLDSARVSAEMHETGCDGVFVTRIVDQKTVTTYYPSTPSYLAAPHRYGWYGSYPSYGHYSWYGYYSLGYSYLGGPGYSVENQVVNFETNLYRVSDGQLVWSALSQEWLAQSETPDTELDPFVRQLVSALLNSKVVAKPGE